MILYFAGITGENKDLDALRRAGASRLLQSFESIQGPPISGAQVIIDSGGFAARTRGVILDVADYARFLNEHRVPLAFNLDTNDHDETMAHQAYLDETCPLTTIIPIYHASDWVERRSLLDQFIEEGRTYIGIGGLVGHAATRSQKQATLDYTFRRTRDKVKVHGLGVTAVDQLRRYPFFSVDSTTWLRVARFGVNRHQDQRLNSFENRTHSRAQRLQIAAEQWLTVERSVTALWAARGITWEGS